MTLTTPAKGEPYLRLGLALLMVGMGVSHFTHATRFLAAMPPWLWPSGHLFLVHSSGAFELAGGVGLLLPAVAPWLSVRRAAAFGLMALYVAVFPANLHMALTPVAFPQAPPWALWARLPIQLVLLAWARRYTRSLARPVNPPRSSPGCPRASANSQNTTPPGPRSVTLRAMTTNDSPRLDAQWLEPHWMPFTGNRQFKKNPRMFVSADGAYYTDTNGKRIFDGLSGLWCTGLGHARREIVEAVQKQIAKLDYSPAFQFGHPGSFELANKVKDLTPKGLDYVFFTGSGSESADTSLKLARAYWRAKGKGEKTRLIGREKGYHGVNFGGISVGGIVGNRKVFGQGVEADHMRHTQVGLRNPAHAFARGQPKDGAELADDLLQLITLHDASNIAAVIVEPFAGSAGVVIPPVGYLQRLREICTKNGILLIFDEVISAFGRAGAYTGAEAFGVTPDMLNFAKQVTNGVQPLGGVIATKEIYDTFMAGGGPEYMLETPHGYTYSAHPVACAAGNASLDLLVKEDAIGRVKALAPYFEEQVHSLKGRKHLTDIRNFGLAAGLTLEAIPGEPAKRPYEVAMKCLDKGLYVRYGGDTIQMAPPFISEKSEIERMISIVADALDATD